MPFRADPRLASARLRALLQQLVLETGSQKAAAATLGMKPNVFGKTLNEKRSEKDPSGAWYLAAFARLGLPIDYFLADGPDDLNYREFLQRRGAAPPVITQSDLAAVTQRLEELRADIRRMRADDGADESNVRRKAARRPKA